MILLVTHGHPTLERYSDPHLGRLVQPRHFSSIGETARSGSPWAADNDAFNGWGEESAARYLQMLDALEGLPGCRFVAAPDVVGDALATATLFAEWEYEIRRRGLPVCLVAQDGIDDLARGCEPQEMWDPIDALFIGGSTEFKLGEVAADLCREAKAAGKWVHMGRVNSLKRIRYAREIGCDSVDGSSFSIFPNIWIPMGLSAVKAGPQMTLSGD